MTSRQCFSLVRHPAPTSSVISKSSLKSRRQVYMAAFNVRTLKQARPQAALDLTLDLLGIDAPKPLTQLKNIHNEHFTKLHNKSTSETDLLDDIRPNGQSIWRVWRALLDESNNLALSHLRASETQQRICRDLKPLKLQRIAVGKRVFEQLRTLQGDLAACVQEMVKSHKVYAEEEKQAQETRLKAMATEEKIRRRSTDIFHSMAQLHRNYEKLIIRRQAYDARSATARNEYLFQLAAINAHLKHYFTKDVPSLVKTLDGELFEKLSEVLSTLSQHEAEMCALTRERFQRVFRDASQITRSYAWESFLRACPLFDKAVQYQFEPMEGDEITLLRSPDAKEASLEQIARKLARRLVLRERRIASYENELKTLQTGSANPHNNSQAVPGSPDSENQEELLSFNQEYVEHKVEEIQFAIRREEIERVKIEACLGLLRNSAVEVKQFVAEARAAADAAVSAALAQQLRETDGGLISDLRVTSHLSDRPTGEGSSDSVSSSIDNQRIFSRHYATPRGSRSNTLGAGYLTRGHTPTSFQLGGDLSIAPRLSEAFSPFWKATRMLAEFGTLRIISDVPALYGMTAMPIRSLLDLDTGANILLN
ncbi:FCH and double SH3 domains protein 2 [Clonorchis sinensis]|uniref:FCH and double SH3 domains protein 2 n=1 Tax=Clonorchis sinensis TaxID=79923 RepID=H2KVM5_CLOSI|nr:FCH and double SH3 domains protein 2 [Clonorchis sinensis]